jgi:hypothetical protein
MDVRARFPLTRQYLGSAGPAADSVEAYVRAVCDAHAKGDIPSRAVRDLVRYEALLLEVPAQAPPIAPLPKDEEPCILAPHARLHVFGADLPSALKALRAGELATPRPARGWLVLLPGAQLLLLREEGWFLESFRKATSPSEVIEDDEDRALFERMWNAGVLVHLG